jgi:hypothetical protein
MGWMADESGFDPCQGQENFIFPIGSRRSLGPDQPPILQASQADFSGVKWQGRAADYSHSSSDEYKNDELYTYLHSPIHLQGVVLN